MASTTTPSKPKDGPSGFTRQYLLAYNALSFFLWAACTNRVVRLLFNQAVTANAIDIPSIFAETYSPLLQTAQSLALLEILHSLIGIVRAPLLTTAMQVASRLFVVWGVIYPFHERGDGNGIVGGDLLSSSGNGNKIGDYAFLGCLGAWGLTECIRYGFFVMQVKGGPASVPDWWNWLRYNTFYVLYPVGISSECTLVVKALPNAAALHPLYWWFFVAVLAIYVPGSYILYTHMIKQRRRTSIKRD